jgi:hypothetical protein
MRLRLLMALLALSATAHAQSPQEWGAVTRGTRNVPLVGVPASLTANAAFTTPCITASGARAFTVFGALNKAGTLQVQRYDATCTQPIGAAIPSSALVLAATSKCPVSSFCGSLSSNDGSAYSSLKISLADTSNSTNTVVGLLQGAGE